MTRKMLEIINMFHKHQRNAINNGREWDLTLADYQKVFSMTCAMTGKSMTLNSNQPNTLSIDRIDNKKGYVKGNVQFVCWCMNRGKGSLTNNQFSKIYN